ncbi:MAG: dicarboxylate/amino acid:cation symporter [Deltaproteobacteria bacterium]|nr:dicarboxylate/amino acid:cation symporter [Deltaproteobacteria bacterium]
MSDLPDAATRRVSPYLLPALLVAGAALGFLIGGVFGDRWADPSFGFFVGFVRLLGQVFMNVLKLVVVPLIVLSMTVGVAAMGDMRKVGGLFGFTFAYYILTTVLAVMLGLVLVHVVHPGVGIGTAQAAAPSVPTTVQWYDALFGLVEGMFPANLTKAAADNNVLRAHHLLDHLRCDSHDARRAREARHRHRRHAQRRSAETRSSHRVGGAHRNHRHCRGPHR